MYEYFFITQIHTAFYWKCYVEQTICYNKILIAIQCRKFLQRAIYCLGMWKSLRYFEWETEEKEKSKLVQHRCICSEINCTSSIYLLHSKFRMLVRYAWCILPKYELWPHRVNNAPILLGDIQRGDVKETMYFFDTHFSHKNWWKMKSYFFQRSRRAGLTQ